MLINLLQLPSIQAALIILMLLFVGWFMSWKKWMLKEHKPFVIKLIVNIAIPSMAIVNYFDSFSREMLLNSAIMLLAPLITISMSYFIASILAFIIKIDNKRKGSFITMCSVSNSIFIGLPVCQSLFGDVSIPYVMFYYMVNTIMFWGIFNPKIREDGQGKSEGFKETILRIINPPLITIIVCSILLIVGLRPPIIILKTTRYLGAMTTPLSLILAGKVMHETGFKNIRFDLSIILIMMMRFVIAPFIAFFISKGMKLEGLVTQVFTIQASMPVMTLTTVSAEAYGADSGYVASAVSITTIGSLIFIPIYMSLMQMLL